METPQGLHLGTLRRTQGEKSQRTPNILQVTRVENTMDTMESTKDYLYFFLLKCVHQGVLWDVLHVFFLFVILSVLHNFLQSVSVLPVFSRVSLSSLSSPGCHCPPCLLQSVTGLPVFSRVTLSSLSSPECHCPPCLL